MLWPKLLKKVVSRRHVVGVVHDVQRQLEASDERKYLDELRTCVLPRSTIRSLRFDQHWSQILYGRDEVPTQSDALSMSSQSRN